MLYKHLLTNNSLKFMKYLYRSVNSIAPKVKKPVHKYGGKLKGFSDLCDQYLLQRIVINNINEHKFSELIVDQNSKQNLIGILEMYEEMKINEINGCYPSDITIEDMRYMLNLPNVELKLKHLRYLFVREFDRWRNDNYNKENSRQRKIIREFEENMRIGVFDENNQIQYGYYRNCMFQKRYTFARKKYSLNRLHNAALFGQKIVIDCSFNETMADFETNSAGGQLSGIYLENRKSEVPYDLHFCNCDPNSRVITKFKKILSNAFGPENFVNCHEESYLELFPDSRFIYLTPDTSYTMTEYDHNAIYLIGATVDKTTNLPLTKFKAIYENIEYYRLPLHFFVNVEPQAKRILNFMEVFTVMNSFKQQPNWKLAFETGIKEIQICNDNENLNYSTCEPLV